MIFYNLLTFYEHFNDIDTSIIYIYIYIMNSHFLYVFRIFWEFLEIKIIKKMIFFKENKIRKKRREYCSLPLSFPLSLLLPFSLSCTTKILSRGESLSPSPLYTLLPHTYMRTWGRKLSPPSSSSFLLSCMRKGREGGGKSSSPSSPPPLPSPLSSHACVHVQVRGRKFSPESLSPLPS